MTTPVYVSLGDSLVSGDGVGQETQPEQAWAGLLAAAAGARFVGLARGGAPIAAVLREQLPQARALSPRVACVSAGMNDLFRSGGAARADDALEQLVCGLRDAGTTVVIGRLHDPTCRLRLPDKAGRAVREHAARINARLDRLAADPGVLLLDFAVLLDRDECWAVDRMHPSGYGHRVLAAGAAQRIGVTRPVPLGVPPRAPTSAAFYRWVLRHGVPWLALRTPELVGSPMLRRRARRSVAALPHGEVVLRAGDVVRAEIATGGGNRVAEPVAGTR